MAKARVRWRRRPTPHNCGRSDKDVDGRSGFVEQRSSFES